MYRTIVVLTAAALGVAGPASAQPQTQAPVAAGTPAGQRAMANPDVITVRNVTRLELTLGLMILEDGGETIGAVTRLEGNDVIVADEKQEYRVPITQLFVYSQDGVDRFASRMTKSALKAQAKRTAAMQRDGD